MLTNFRFRYNPREGNDLYIVFNEGRNTYRNIDEPRLPLYNSRSILVKYTYTFTFDPVKISLKVYLLVAGRQRHYNYNFPLSKY